MAESLLRDRDPRFRLLGWRVGGTALLLLVLVAALTAYLGHRSGLFEAKTRISFVAENGSGLATGLQVRLSGFRIGVIDSVELNDEAKVDVSLLIETRYMKWVKDDALAILQQDGLVGDQFIEIAGGGSKAPALKDGGVLTFVPAMSFGDIAQDLRNRTLPVIDEFNRTMQYVNDPQGDLRQMMGNFRQMSQDLKQTRERLDALLLHADQVTNQELRSTLQTSQGLLARADTMVAGVNQRLPALLDNAASAVQNVQAATSDASAVMHELRGVVEQSAPRLPGMVRNADELVQDAGVTLDGLKRSWPLSSMLPEAKDEGFVPESRP